MSKNSDSPKKKEIEKQFNEQDKKFNFRHPDILSYRKQVEKTLSDNNLKERFKAIKSKKFKQEEITNEKLEKRGKAYGVKPIQFIFDRDKEGNFSFIAKNIKSGKVIEKEINIKDLSNKELRSKLKKTVKSEPFNYNKFYIKEDTEPERDRDNTKNVTISYTTFYRYGIIIYRLRKGKKYEVIFQASTVENRSIYVSYQRVIAQLKSDILKETGISLEEWLYLSRTQNNIYVEGGLSYRRFKGRKVKDQAFKEKIDYEFNIDFEEVQ